jgi:hypothetical protein
MKQAKVLMIGCGGIGSWLVEPLARYLNYSSYEMVELALVDGDSFEAKNLNRQLADQMDNKAQVLIQRIKKLDRLSVRAKSVYVTEENVGEIIQERHIVMVCVDNRATRKDVLVICGMNDKDTGDILVYQRKGGKDITLPFTHLPEIQFPNDKNPGDVQKREAGCDVLQAETPQLICANLMAAAMMLNAICTISDNYENWPGYDHGAFDTRTNNAKSQRKVRDVPGPKPVQS